jgi:hypothetical protein
VAISGLRADPPRADDGAYGARRFALFPPSNSQNALIFQRLAKIPQYQRPGASFVQSDVQPDDRKTSLRCMCGAIAISSLTINFMQDLSSPFGFGRMFSGAVNCDRSFFGGFYAPHY